MIVIYLCIALVLMSVSYHYINFYVRDYLRLKQMEREEYGKVFLFDASKMFIAKKSTMDKVMTAMTDVVPGQKVWQNDFYNLQVHSPNAIGQIMGLVD
jgi:hypothetical protein